MQARHLQQSMPNEMENAMETPQAVIATFLTRYGDALSQGHLTDVSDCWEMPALVVSDEGAVAVGTPEEVERFFAQAVAWYRTQGYVATRPTIVRGDWLGERLISADVQWAALDSTGNVKMTELTRYIIRLDDGGQPRIRVAVQVRPVSLMSDTR
jgi:hypothetical protein